MRLIGNAPGFAAGTLNLAVALALPLAIAAPLGLAPLLLAAALFIVIGDGWPTRVHRRFAIATAVLTLLVTWGRRARSGRSIRIAACRWPDASC